MESITTIAQAQTEALLAVSGASARNTVSFIDVVAKFQTEQLLGYPNSFIEGNAAIAQTAAATRAAQGPILPPPVN